MKLHEQTYIQDLLTKTPECEEFLYPFMKYVHRDTTIAELALMTGTSLNALFYGLERTIKRAEQNRCNYDEMKCMLLKPGRINIAGLVNFLWQNAFINELQRRAQKLGIDLNMHIFPKHEKKRFQNYLSLCRNADDLPEILIGKGFSSFMTSRFIGRFVKPGYFRNPLPEVKMSSIFRQAGMADADNDYHPFGVEEMIMVHDKTVQPNAETPSSWDDILTPRYRGTLAQMGKNRRDHFGFATMLYLYADHGEQSIKQYAANVKNKQHFSSIVKNIGRNHTEAAPINVMHQFAGMFIRSEAQDKTEVIVTCDGNPAVCNFFLVKNKADSQALAIASHLYSPQIRAILEKCGTNHITSNTLLSNNTGVRWIGWNTIKTLPHPYMKEYLSEIAFNNYKIRIS